MCGPSQCVGTSVSKVVRDSIDKPRAKQKQKAVGPPPLPPSPAPKPERQVTAWAPPRTVAKRRVSSATAHLLRTAALEGEHLRRRLQEVGAGLRPASSRPAAERLSALRERVLWRSPE